MAFVPGFDHDIFISYAHANNMKRADTDPKGWIEDLHDVLTERLTQHLGRAEYFAIWRDHRLPGYDRVDPAIAEKVRKSALFLCVLSPSYLASPYCLEELQIFREASSGDAAAGLGNRVIKVKLLPVPGDKEPAVLREVAGYEFYTVEKTNRARELWRNYQNAAYWDAALTLGEEIAELLEKLKLAQQEQEKPRLLPNSRPQPPVNESIVPTVYLAEATDELAKIRLKLKRNLKQQGIRILPDAPLPNSPALATEIERHLRAAHLAVHLVGADFGDRAFGDTEARSLAHVQYLRAKELGHQRIVWMSPELQGDGKVKDKRQQRFLNFLEDEHEPEPRVDLQRGHGFEAMVAEVVKKAFAVAGVRRPPGQLRRGATPQIDIVYQQPDLAEAMDLKKLVHQNKFDVIVSVDDDDIKFSTRYQQILKRSDGVLILYGKASPVWVTARADQARAAVRKRTKAGKGPFVALVYDGPPPDKGDLPFGYQEVAVVTGRDQLARDEIVATIKNHLGE